MQCAFLPSWFYGEVFYSCSFALIRGSSFIMIMVLLLSGNNVKAYRELRLHGLQESPTAFGSSYERESVQDDEFFAQRIAATDDQWTCGAFAGGRLVGVLSFVRDAGDKTRHRGALYGMYVHPDSRRQGIGRQLMVDMLKRTDALSGLRSVRLSVTDGNTAAEKLYQSLGFGRYGSEPEVLCVDDRYYGEHHLVRRMPDD